LLMSVALSAQVEPQPVASPEKDTTSVNRQLQKESDMKTMDAVKTQDHSKPLPKPKKTSKHKNTAKAKKRVQ